MKDFRSLVEGERPYLLRYARLQLRDGHAAEDAVQETLLAALAGEAAFAGRSNVGKSTAINALLGRRGLARTSKTPGRTQTINFYEADRAGERARLVDLPGYGFARVPLALRDRWRALVGATTSTCSGTGGGVGVSLSWLMSFLVAPRVRLSVPSASRRRQIALT